MFIFNEYPYLVSRNKIFRILRLKIGKNEKSFTFMMEARISAVFSGYTVLAPTVFYGRLHLKHVTRSIVVTQIRRFIFIFTFKFNSFKRVSR